MELIFSILILKRKIRFSVNIEILLLCNLFDKQVQCKS